MNAEPASMSEPPTRLRRIAILWRGDEAARRSATPETSRFNAELCDLICIVLEINSLRNIKTVTDGLLLTRPVAALPPRRQTEVFQHP
jgi:hypothetical protein